MRTKKEIKKAIELIEDKAEVSNFRRAKELREIAFVLKWILEEEETISI